MSTIELTEREIQTVVAALRETMKRSLRAAHGSRRDIHLHYVAQAEAAAAVMRKLGDEDASHQSGCIE